MPVVSLAEAGDVHSFGGKAANLAKLLQNDLPVPPGLAVGLDAFEGDKLSATASASIQAHVSPDKLYAVRSSALAEDAEGASWAGQFETFLDTKYEDIVAKVEECHNSTKNRAKAYAADKDEKAFNIAVVIQEMVKPEYAGVLFTKDPITGQDQLVTEYVEGLGEELVSGRADPKRIVLHRDKVQDAPFDTQELATLAAKVEQLFGVPQDIEWTWANGKIWLVQARPITTTQESREGYYLGEPDGLFYWGPSRAQPMYMSDFMAAAERLFVKMAVDPALPYPPKTIVLFHGGKMVWLSNAQDFADFTEQTFEAYEKSGQLEKDISNWQSIINELKNLSGDEFLARMVDAWFYTEFAEFALYGAEAVLIKRLERLDPRIRQEIWGAFTVPDKPTFLAGIDAELIASKDPDAIAQKYPWIEDGYGGLSTNASEYFKKRLDIIGEETYDSVDYHAKRQSCIEKYSLSDEEVSALTLARKLAEFMDDRKAWMMQTRRSITKSLGDIEHGWFFNDGKASAITQKNADEFWERYVDFKASTNAVTGVVASNGGRHFVNGEVVVVGSPTDSVADDKIVVVPSTSPSYVPLMRKARALITDHGGMMSHAAIVAREFNLPCIVGTKQGTKVLQTGDKVVLDLVKGEVNK